MLERLEDIEHARFRALAQVVIDKDKGVEAFEDYMRISFPGMEKRKKKSNEEMGKLLKSWTATGPLKVTPFHEKRTKSRLRQRLVKVENERLESLYGKLRNG